MSELDYRTILDFEETWALRHTGKDEAIRRVLDVSPTVYHQALNAALDTPEALEYRPLTVKALQRRRAALRIARQKRSAS